MAEVQLPERASAVVIGGGVTGASVAYHLARLGWNDVLLLERKQFACGTTWHAAGLIGTMRANESHARLCEYSMSLLSELEREHLKHAFRVIQTMQETMAKRFSADTLG